MTKLLYLANIRLPTEKAHGVQILKMCEAFARMGMSVELVVPRRRTAIEGDPFGYYGIEKIFSITYIPTLDTVSWGRAGYLFQSFLFALGAGYEAWRRKADIVYSRDEMTAGILSFFPRERQRLVWETHTGAWNYFARRAAQRARAVIAISTGLKDFYARQGIPAAKIAVAHDAADLEVFEHSEPWGAARKRLGLPLDKKLVLYIGRIDGWKGVDTLCKAAAALPPEVRVAVIGGEPEQVARMRETYPHVIFLGYRPYRELPHNLAAADVLVIPNSAENIVSATYTSPLKLFAYMAAGKPIVASDIPSLREIISDDTAYFAEPDDPVSFAKAIIRAITRMQEAYARAQHARAEVRKYDWKNRARLIVDFIA